MIYQKLGLAIGAICCFTIIYIPFFLLQVWIYRRTKELAETYESNTDDVVNNEHSSVSNLNGKVQEMQTLRKESLSN